jgi:hypothetical protein
MEGRRPYNPPPPPNTRSDRKTSQPQSGQQGDSQQPSENSVIGGVRFNVLRAPLGHRPGDVTVPNGHRNSWVVVATPVVAGFSGCRYEFVEAVLFTSGMSALRQGCPRLLDASRVFRAEQALPAHHLRPGGPTVAGHSALLGRTPSATDWSTSA